MNWGKLEIQETKLDRLEYRDEMFKDLVLESIELLGYEEVADKKQSVYIKDFKSGNIHLDTTCKGRVFRAGANTDNRLDKDIFVAFTLDYRFGKRFMHDRRNGNRYIETEPISTYVCRFDKENNRYVAYGNEIQSKENWLSPYYILNNIDNSQPLNVHGPELRGVLNGLGYELKNSDFGMYELEYRDSAIRVYADTRYISVKLGYQSRHLPVSELGAEAFTEVTKFFKKKIDLESILG